MKRAGWLAILGLLLLGGLLTGGRAICPLPLRPRAQGPPAPTAAPAASVPAEASTHSSK